MRHVLDGRALVNEDRISVHHVWDRFLGKRHVEAAYRKKAGQMSQSGVHTWIPTVCKAFNQ